MIAHTKAFERYRTQAQNHLDFVVLVASAVPNLAELLGIDRDPIVRPDYFKLAPSDRTRLKLLARRYQPQLASLSVVALFSYFEEYVKATLREIVEFHGGAESFLKLAYSRAARFLGSGPDALQSHKRKLQEHAKPGKTQKYQKHSRTLSEAGFRFPTELLAPYGANLLLQKADKKQGLRAWEIASVLEDALLLSLTPKHRSRVEQIRHMRNKIAHGDTVHVDLKAAMEVSRDLHAIGAKIDAHIVEHFLVLQKFAT